VGSWRETLSEDQVDRPVPDHHQVMQRFGCLNEAGKPVYGREPMRGFLHFDHVYQIFFYHFSKPLEHILLTLCTRYLVFAAYYVANSRYSMGFGEQFPCPGAHVVNTVIGAVFDAHHDQFFIQLTDDYIYRRLELSLQGDFGKGVQLISVIITEDLPDVKHRASICNRRPRITSFFLPIAPMMLF